MLVVTVDLLKYCTYLEVLKYFHFCFFVILLHYSPEVDGVLLHYMYLKHVVTLQIWINDVKYNQLLNQTLITPGVNSQATLRRLRGASPC